jgi:predicted phosphodiesterase
MSRTIVIGDVHGCHQELRDLLDKVAPEEGDRLISLGDLVNRGPDSHAVFELAREVGMEAVMGNHELRLLRYRRTKDDSILKDYDFDTLRQLSQQDWAVIEGMHKVIELPELRTVLVHGGFLPGRPWQGQSLDLITWIQVINGDGKPAKRSHAPEGEPWADQWQGPPFVIYGHTPRANILRRRWSLGIDTACVYGGQLTAAILPERRIVKVPARAAYAHSRTLPDPVERPPL